MSIIKIRTQVIATLMALALGLTACGGGGGDDAPSYALRIDSAVVSTSYPTEGSALLKGEGFLPPGSRCAEDPSPFAAVPVFDHLGLYTLTWTNAATGKSGETRLYWNCGAAPTWGAWVPLAPGENHITVTMVAGSLEQKADVVVTRQ